MAAVLGLIAVAGAAYALGGHLRLRAGLPLVVAVFAAVLAVDDPGNVVPAALVTAAPFLAGRAVRSRRALARALAARTRELEAEEEEHARLAVERERVRVARDLHDVVGHHLAVVVVQAGAGRLDGTDATARFAAIHDAAADALADLARLPHTAPKAGPERVAVMLERARLAGLHLAAGPLEALAALDAERRAIAHSVLQEGLTNAIKHAPDSVVHLGAEAADDMLEVVVADEGGRAAAGAADLGAAGGRAGLAGLRARVTAAGGTLRAGPGASGGWRLTARLPLPAGATGPPSHEGPGRASAG